MMNSTLGRGSAVWVNAPDASRAASVRNIFMGDASPGNGYAKISFTTLP